MISCIYMFLTVYNVVKTFHDMSDCNHLKTVDKILVWGKRSGRIQIKRG